MRNKAKLFGIYLPIYIVLALSTIAMRTVALFTQLDFKTEYFSNKTLINISTYILIAGVVFLFTYIFTSRRDLKLIPDFTSAATYIPTGIVSVAIIFITISLLLRSARILNRINELKEFGTLSALEQIPTQRILLIVVLLTSVFAVLSIIHFALTALIENRSNTKRANFGICTVVFLAFYSLYLYFSNDLPINAPNKALDQMTYLFAAVFFLYETRLSFGRERWRHYIAFGFIASLISAYSSIPSLILYFAKGHVTANSVYEIALTFAMFIFITSRLLLAADLIESKESDTAIALMRASDLRDGQINPIPETPAVIDIEGESLDPAPDEDTDGNQITIDDMGIEIESNAESSDELEEIPEASGNVEAGNEETEKNSSEN